MAWARQGDRGDTDGAARKSRMGSSERGTSGLEQQCEKNPQNWKEPSWESWGVKL